MIINHLSFQFKNIYFDKKDDKYYIDTNFDGLSIIKYFDNSYVRFSVSFIKVDKKNKEIFINFEREVINNEQEIDLNNGFISHKKYKYSFRISDKNVFEFAEKKLEELILTL